MGQSASRVVEEKKTPHQVLEIEETADVEEVKRAYRRLALLHHPDSSRTSSSEAQRFIEIHSAYRQIIEGRAPKAKRSKPLEPTIDMARCMATLKAIKAVSEEDFSQINALFTTLSSIEQHVRPHYKQPPFGYLKGDPKNFYTFFQTFKTYRTFNITPESITPDYPRYNRRERREIDLEASRLISAKRKEYETQVREVVKMLKLKDPRLKALEKAREEVLPKLKIKREGKELQDVIGLTEEERRILEDEERKNPSAKPKEPSGELYHCKVCNKTFKSTNQFINHEQSKKHREKLDSMDVEDIKSLIQELQSQKIEITPTGTYKEERGKRREKEKGEGEEEQRDERSEGETKREEEKTKEKEKTREREEGKGRERGRKVKKAPVSRKEKEPSARPKRSADVSFTLTCAKCKDTFDSRNRLFHHLKDSGHGTPL